MLICLVCKMLVVRLRNTSGVGVRCWELEEDQVNFSEIRLDWDSYLI